MRNKNTRTAIVVVNWNGFEDTRATLESLEAVSGRDLWILVVDNGSTDDSVTRLKDLQQRGGRFELIEGEENNGFAAGNVIGLRRVLGDDDVGWILLLNNDVEVAEDFLEPLIEACLDDGVGAAGPKIFYADPPDRLWAAGGRLRLRETVTEEFGRGQADGPEWDRAIDVTYLTTCCLLIPRDALRRVGFLDPVFFLNVDDADWCRRALDVGYRLRYVPQSRIWHKVASATGGSYTPLKTFHTARSNTLFVRRHMGVSGLLAFLAVNAVTLPAAALRELRRGNLAAVLSKGRGIWRGLMDPLPEPPTVGCH